MKKVVSKKLQRRLKLKKIPDFNYDFDDVIENVEKLLIYYFPKDKKTIELEVENLANKYCEKIDGDYDEFMRIANKTKAFNKWSDFSLRITEGLSPISYSVLDLYFQINMVPNYDVYNDVLIYAYWEDIQPYLD
jgi:hypothetical protein